MLVDRGFKIIEKGSLQTEYTTLNMPLSMVPMSWGGRIPCPLDGTANTYLAKTLFELKKSTYQNQHISDLISTWMQKLPGKNKYLVSLNQKDYLVAVSESINVEDVLTVAKTWNIDSYIGVFDDTCSTCFVFDVEFGLTLISFEPSNAPAGYEQFSQTFNKEFKKFFARDAKLRTGADPARAKEYLERIQNTIG